MERSEKRAATEIAYASLVVKVDGREALPVRAIPYVTGWSITPDVVARQFARVVPGGFEKLQRSHTYHHRDGRVVKLLPKEWDAYVSALDGLEAELKRKFKTDDEGYAAWVSHSVSKLPSGVFVWLDDFTADWQRDFGSQRRSILEERPGDRDLNLSPYLDHDTLNVVLEGFGLREAVLTRSSLEVVACFAEHTFNGHAIDWGYWIEKMPTLSVGEAARLMAGLDPELFEDLSARPVKKNDASRACTKAKRMQHLASAQGRERCTPADWLCWAYENGFTVHPGFDMAVREQQMSENAAQVLAEMPRVEASVWESAPEVGGGRRRLYGHYGMNPSPATVVATFPEFVAEVAERLARWRRGLYELVEAAHVLARSNSLDAEQIAAQMENAIRAGRLLYRRDNIPMDAHRIPTESLRRCVLLLRDVNTWLTESGASYQLEYPYQKYLETFVPLEGTIEPYAGLSFAQLPPQIADLVRDANFLIPWDALNPDQRMHLARQRDSQADPELQPLRDFYFHKTVRLQDLNKRIESVKGIATPTMTDYHLQQQTLRELDEELKRVKAEQWQGDAKAVIDGHEPLAVSAQVTTSQTVKSPDEEESWVEQARNLAKVKIQRARELDRYPNQIVIADEIAEEFRRRGVVGPSGKPLYGSTIKRHALRGIFSEVDGRLSPRKPRSK